MDEVPDRFEWPAGWKPFPLPDGWLGLAPAPETELMQEICPGHLLHGVSCRAVGFNGDDPNEFLFATDNPAAPLAFVHLTWTVERDPFWPYTVSYKGWEEFQAAWQVPDAE